jgi:methionyl-tRNA formyltransferase
MKVCLITNKHNIFFRLYLEHLKKIPKKDLIIVIENSVIPRSDIKLENSRISSKFKKRLLLKKYPNIQEYKFKEVRSINTQQFVNFVKKQKISFLLNCSIGVIVKKKYLFRKIINIHPGYLPKYRGCNCPEWTLFNKDIPAISAHLMDKSIDLGPIIKRKFIQFNYENYKDFRSRIYEQSIKLGCKVLTDIYTKKKLDKKNLIFQTKENGFYHKPMPNKIFKMLRFVKNEKHN